MNVLTSLFYIGGDPDSAHGGMGGDCHFPAQKRMKCPVCGRPGVAPPYNVNHWENITASLISSDDTQTWFDWVFTVSGLLASERMVEDMKSTGCTGFIPHPVVSIVHKGSKHLNVKGAPRYYFIEPLGSVEFDRRFFDTGSSVYCPACRNWKPIPLPRCPRYFKLPDLETYSGHDVCRWRNLPALHCVISRKVMELGFERSWYPWWVHNHLGVSQPSIPEGWEKPFLERCRRYWEGFGPEQPPFEVFEYNGPIPGPRATV